MKTYCISDIHGHLDNFKRFVDTLNEDDKVYVLGDVVDKGDKPIEILQYIMNDNRFVMLLGNHEYMMYKYLTAPNESSEKMEAAEQWLDYNSGTDTYFQYLALSKDEQKKILNYISNLQVNIPELIVNNKKFYLVHACPFTYETLTTESEQMAVESSVWERIPIEYIGYDDIDFKDRQLIIGHTCVQNYIDECKPLFNAKDIKDAPIINIDGGLAYPFGNEKLIALCLDDLSYMIY